MPKVCYDPDSLTRIKLPFVLVATGDSPPSTPLWVTLAATAIPAVVAFIASVVGVRATHRARRAEAETARLREVEARVDTRKYETYKPMLDLLQDILSSANKASGVTLPPEQQMLRQIADFTTWLGVFGSDDAVIAFSRFMQATWHNVPPNILMRLWADLVLAARRDMGYRDTKVGPRDVLAMRFTDIYDERAMYEMASMPLNVLAIKYGWPLPWENVPSEETGP